MPRIAPHRGTAAEAERVSNSETSLLDRLPPRAQLALVLLVVLLSAGWGVGMLVLQHRLLEMEADGRFLGGVPGFFADGSSRATAWVGWAAAFFFLLSYLRLVRGSPEPPAGRPHGKDWTVAEMRAALRREFRMVRFGLAVVDVLAMFDVARAVAYAIASATRDDVARANLLIVGVEAGGLVCAAALLTAWMLAFRRQLESWGAL
jgi:hypothetical protein